MHGIPVAACIRTGRGLHSTALAGPHWGSDIHVMLALRHSSRQVVVADEELNGTDMVRELLGKR
jgi:hypothetical protein